jgi:hypothetical protein
MQILISGSKRRHQELKKDDSAEELSALEVTVSRQMILTSPGEGDDRFNDHAEPKEDDENHDPAGMRAAAESDSREQRFLKSVTAGTWVTKNCKCC